MQFTVASARWQRWTAFFLIAMAMVQGIVFWRASTLIMDGYADFTSFYTAGLMVRRGYGDQLYDRAAQYRLQLEFAPLVTRKGPLPFIRPPFVALFFAPLSVLRYPMAITIWFVLKLGVLVLALWILQRPFGRIYPLWLEAVLCLGFYPVSRDLLYGQDAVILFLLFVLTFNSILAHSDGAAGIYLGLALFKFNVVLPMLLLLCLAGRWRVLRGFVPVAIGWGLLSAVAAGPGIMLKYPSYLIDLNRAQHVGFVHTQSMPNVRGLLTPVLGAAPYPGPIHWILLPLAIAAIAYAASLWRRQVDYTQGVVLAYGLGLVLTLLTSYYSYVYDMILLLLPLLVLSAEFREQGALDSRTCGFLVLGFVLLLSEAIYGDLLLHHDLGYLLSIPMLIVTIGLIHGLKNNDGGRQKLKVCEEEL